MANADFNDLISSFERYFYESKKEVMILCCTEQHINVARQSVIEKWGENAINLPNICLMQVYLISEYLNNQYSSHEIHSLFPLYRLTDAEWEEIGAICKKTDASGEAFLGGSIGAITGFLFGGVIGAAIGGIGGAVQGSSSASNNRERYYNVLREAIEKFYFITEREMKREIGIASRYIRI